jgi:hypothetical protein
MSLQIRLEQLLQKLKTPAKILEFKPPPGDPPMKKHRTCSRRRAPAQRRGCPLGPPAPLKGCKSIVELPGAPPQPWIVRNPSTPADSVAHYLLKSERLKNERGVSVYMPPGDRVSGAPAALLIVSEPTTGGAA